MNATEVYVEQVIIGGLVLLIAVVLWLGGVPPLSIFGWPLTPTVIVLLAAAYLIGMLFDRIADTLLERIEKRQRLERALTVWKHRPWGDPWPEDEYRAAVFRNEHLVEQFNYLRIRLRLSRAVAVLAPAGTVALLVYLECCWRPRIAIAVVAAYVVVGAFNVIAEKAAELPRTDDSKKFGVYAAWSGSHRWWAAYGPAIIGLYCFLEIMLAVRWQRWRIAFAGIALTILATWVWVRITGTFLSFLRDAQKTASR